MSDRNNTPEARLKNCETQIIRLRGKIKYKEFNEVETEEVMRHDLRIWLLQQTALQSMLAADVYQHQLDL